jgi:hypothetical protein
VSHSSSGSGRRRTQESSACSNCGRDQEQQRLPWTTKQEVGKTWLIAYSWWSVEARPRWYMMLDWHREPATQAGRTKSKCSTTAMKINRQGLREKDQWTSTSSGREKTTKKSVSVKRIPKMAMTQQMAGYLRCKQQAILHIEPVP